MDSEVLGMHDTAWDGLLSRNQQVVVRRVRGISASSYLHDSHKLESGIGRVFKLLGLHPRWPEVVAAKLHVRIDPRVDGDNMVVQSPIECLRGRKGGELIQRQGV